MGLAVLLVILAYAAVLIGAPIVGYKLAAKHGWPASRRRLAAVFCFLLIFLPMFWDWLPTIWLHSYYCEKYSGLTVSKTPEQWQLANPGAAQTITRAKEPLVVGEWPKLSSRLNGRFRVDSESIEKALWLREREERIVDEVTGEVLVRFIDFSTGQQRARRLGEFRDIKLWMRRDSCQGDFQQHREFSVLRQAFANLGDQK